jgi:hypothetical protein
MEEILECSAEHRPNMFHLTYGLKNGGILGMKICEKAFKIAQIEILELYSQSSWEMGELKLVGRQIDKSDIKRRYRYRADQTKSVKHAIEHGFKCFFRWIQNSGASNTISQISFVLSALRKKTDGNSVGPRYQIVYKDESCIQEIKRRECKNHVHDTRAGNGETFKSRSREIERHYLIKPEDPSLSKYYTTSKLIQAMDHSILDLRDKKYAPDIGFNKGDNSAVETKPLCSSQIEQTTCIICLGKTILVRLIGC